MAATRAAGPSVGRSWFRGSSLSHFESHGRLRGAVDELPQTPGAHFISDGMKGNRVPSIKSTVRRIKEVEMGGSPATHSLVSSSRSGNKMEFRRQRHLSVSRHSRSRPSLNWPTLHWPHSRQQTRSMHAACSLTHCFCPSVVRRSICHFMGTQEENDDRVVFTGT